mmetsp:Transcript_7622/g.18424  ORF Transcript_7622/g.18424 Transcript_7622/m.18424 type:complete len:374 (-) Transcript_7622:730-1851(-)|eukprot:CAMPEP_0201118566 /NCGR_PEP_ID=MMETSP0850-20130426/2772_1 /ASSEMBLY_ACC=CAM_ASM_000622 /TAXON_ID=183588 /ORGANISM="Pseudo-nitzschia fraudulenta, Strain WWA7" /LENGTH=373 /DNA_ID=CAMNT_0047383877 /DNA_START=45 /DNA_END=1166 /DNA_ORIENTATION=+
MTSVLGSLRRAREWAYPQLTESAFLEKGVLTPEEFLRAGDELVFRCPTWEWSSSPKASKEKSYLPPNKQYLITRNVPCRNRVSSLETNLKMEREGFESGENGDEGDDWMVSTLLAEGEDDQGIGDGFDILDEDGEVVVAPGPDGGGGAETNSGGGGGTGAGAPFPPEDSGGGGDDDEYADIDDYEDEDVLVDDDAAAGPAASAPSASSETTTNIVKTRTYDLSITYDKYYQVPRVWMVGRNEDDQPLTSGQMMEDVISDYANKTVTMEVHPHVSSSCPHASIHPCQHAKVMKAIVRNLIRGGSSSKGGGTTSADNRSSTKNDDDDGNDGEYEEAKSGPSVENYLFIFLKFVSSMIPTINYDFTMEVTADTSKY